MHVDFLTLACFSDHLDSLLGARVQRVILPDERSVGLELYAGQRFQLLASAEPQQPRMLLVPEKLRRGVDAKPPFLLLLRKWVRGARLVDVYQPPWERSLELHFEGLAGPCRLVVELIGRYSNVLLVGPDGVVLEAVKHVGPDMTRHRLTLPGHPYQLPPPPPNRRPPAGIDAGELAARLRRVAPDERLYRWLIGQFLGVGPVLAREVAARAVGDPRALAGAATAPALIAAFKTLLSPLEDGWWAPHVALDETGTVIAYTPYEPRQFERVEPVPDINRAMWRYFKALEMTDPYAAARQSVRGLVAKTRDRLAQRLAKIETQRVDEKEVADLRLAGELLLTFQADVPPGAREVTLTDYEGAPRTLKLDPKLSPVDNAQAYFRRYQKAQRAAQQVPRLINKVKLERVYLEQLAADLELAESRPEIDAVRDAMAQAGWTGKRRKKSPPVSGPRRFEIQGFPIYVGRNARQNEQITFRRAAPEDLWLHVRDLPGAHVIIKSGRQTVPEEVVQRAAELAAYYSSARQESGQVPVAVTQRRFVRRLRGGYPGLVTFRDERTVFAKPTK